MKSIFCVLALISLDSFDVTSSPFKAETLFLQKQHLIFFHIYVFSLLENRIQYIINPLNLKKSRIM